MSLVTRVLDTGAGLNPIDSRYIPSSCKDLIRTDNDLRFTAAEKQAIYVL